MEIVDSLIHGKWIVPVVPAGQILENHTIVVKGSKIREIIPTNEVMGRYQAHHESHLLEHLIIPGFINAHTQSAMSLFRGIADDLPIKSWLEKHIQPLEKEFIDESFVADATRLSICEMIRSGTTCFADHYYYPESSAEVVSAAGIRARLGIIISDHQTNYAENADDYFSKGLNFADNFKHHPLISCQFAIQGASSVSDELLTRAIMLGTELSIPIQMQIHGSASEIEEAVASSGQRPLKRLERLGLLTPDLQAVHMTDITAEEITLLSECGVQVIHCPESNMKNARGICPVDQLFQSGVNVALATDGAASNNDLDMLAEMKTTSLLAKVATNKSTAVSASKVLEMATINGAKALAIDKEVGSIEIGKQADLIAVDMSAIEQQPLYNPISQLIFTSNRNQITDLWVAGKHLMKDRQLTTLNMQSILANAKEWQQNITQWENLR